MNCFVVLSNYGRLVQVSKQRCFLATIDLTDLISQAEAARLRGVSREAIYDLVARGRLEAIEIGGMKFVQRSEVLGFKERPAGRPAEKARKPSHIKVGRPDDARPRVAPTGSKGKATHHRRKR